MAKGKKELKTNKNKKKRSFRNTLWILVGIGACLFMLLTILSDVLEVGEKLRKAGDIGVYLEWGFYILTVLLLYVLIINPIRIILFSPSFSVVTVLDEENEKNIRVYKRIVNNLVDNNYINEEEKTVLKSCESAGELREELTKVFNTSIKKDINKIIFSNAKTVMLSTAISQNGKFDMYTVLAVNVKMVKEIVLKCGFRPSYPKLGKLTFKVVSTALVAENLEGLDFSDIFPQSTNNALADIPFIKPIAASFVNGISNALLTIRIGVITRRYLFSDGNLSNSQIRVQAIKESLKMIPDVIKEVLVYFPSKIVNGLFKKKKNNEGSESTN